jgi:hypothetical protein
LSRAEKDFLSSLLAGEQVEAFDEEGRHLSGTVETTAPDLGIVWIRTHAGERKLLDVQECSVRRPLDS